MTLNQHMMSQVADQPKENWQQYTEKEEEGSRYLKIWRVTQRI